MTDDTRTDPTPTPSAPFADPAPELPQTDAPTESEHANEHATHHEDNEALCEAVMFFARKLGCADELILHMNRWHHTRNAA